LEVKSRMELPNKKYQIIYADPPWSYEHPISNSRRIENQYDTMSLDEIKQLPVQLISEKDCVLFMWATAPKLAESIEVLNNWGFSYRTCLVWDKLVLGMGYWFRNQHEILLVGLKGAISPPLPELRISSVYRDKREEHSKKPDKIRALITKWYPSYSKIELFAREKLQGWDVWGNESPSSLQTLLTISGKESK
jgi:N6-adenosine-specific RNA methylase IME4